MKVVNPNDFRVQRILEWLCTPKEYRDPKSQSDLAAELDMSNKAINDLKNESSFLKLWEDKYRRTVGSPQKAFEVMSALQETASDRTDPRQVPAARAYLEAIDAIKPKRVEVTVTSQAVKELTDEQLTEMIAARAEAELLERQEQA